MAKQGLQGAQNTHIAIGRAEDSIYPVGSGQVESLLGDGRGLMREQVIGFLAEKFADVVDVHICLSEPPVYCVGALETTISLVMPHVSRRLDLLIVSTDLERVFTRTEFETFCALLPEKRAVIQGGFERVWLDQPGRMLLYANQQGGFRVHCPVNKDNIAGTFGRALVAWKGGAARALRCSACGEQHQLETCELRPPGAFACSAIVFSDVEGTALSAEVGAVLTDTLGPVRVVLRRR